MINQEIVRDISLLYELSLSVGRSLDLIENTRFFLNAMMRRKGLSFGALWLRDKKSPSSEGFELIYAHPKSRIDKTSISSDQFILKQLEDKSLIAMGDDRPEFQACIWEKGISGGCYAFLALGELGFLKLYAFQKKDSLSLKELYKLQSVLSQFKLSLEACLSQEKLIQEIQDREKVEQELRKSKEVEEQFFANMSHEIRTPLNGMLGMMNLMMTTALDEIQKEYIQDMLLSGKTLLAILNDILDFSKIKHGQISLEEVKFDLKARLQSIHSISRAKAVESKLEAILEIGPQVPQFVVGDPVRFEQIIKNLLGNALKFTHKGSVTLAANLMGQADGRIHYVFEIRDTGIGIPRDKLSNIFSNFVQAEKDTSQKYGGTGLGLAIVKQLVELMKGKIEVESGVGVGSVFRVMLPFGVCNQRPLVPQNGHKALEISDSMTGHHILVVEDTVMNQKVAKRLLRRWGAEVDIAENGQMAVDKCKEKAYDLILMDLQMPVMSGYEASRVIRQELSAPISKVPIIALTAAVRETVKREVLEAGMDSYLIKPFEPEALLTMVRFYLQKRSNQETVQAHMDMENTPKAINTAYLEEIANGDQQFVQDMLNLFVEQVPLELEHLQKQIKEVNWPQIRQQVHKLKYPFASIGRLDIKKQLSEMEENAKKEQDIKILKVVYHQILEDTALILQELRS